METTSIGKMLVILGSVILIVGILFLFSDKLPFLKMLGRLPGDINVEKPGFSFHFPLTTSILVSVVLSLLLWLFSKR